MPKEMAVNPRTLALSYVSYLVSNLNKKNYKSSIAELADVSLCRHPAFHVMLSPFFASVGREVRI